MRITYHGWILLALAWLTPGLARAEADGPDHFRVTGGPTPIDLWFDRYYRLVRQEFTEAGHKMIVQLVNVRR